MKEERIEGIVLRAIDFKDRQKIITLLSPNGLLTLIIKGLSSKKPHLLTLSTPFTQAEYVYLKGRSDIYRFVDGSLIDDHLTLRSSYSIVKAAFSCAQIILQSQLPGKPTPHLYTLLSAFLKHIPTFEDPTPLLHSFHLKVLKHEGLLSISPTCTLCSLPALFLDTGECRCQSHASPSALSFTPSEWHTLTQLFTAKTFSELKDLSLPALLATKILSFTKLTIQN